MISEVLAALRAIPRIVDALNQLSDVAVAQMAQRRMESKNEDIEDIIAAATARREQRMLDREAERVQRDSSEE